MRWNSLVGRLFKWVFGWYLLLAILVTGVQLGLEYASIRATIASDLVALGRSFAPGVSDAMWTYDRLLLESLAQGISQTAIVTGVRIENGRGETVARQGTIPSSDAHEDYPGWASFQSHEVPLRSSPLADNQAARPLGRLVLYSDRGVALDRVAYSFVVILVNSLIKTAGLWLIFYLVISWKLSRPLTELSTAVSKLTLSADTSPAALPDYPHQDEIGMLVAALNDMCGRLARKEGHLRLALRGAETGTFVYDPSSGRLSWDERAREIFGAGVRRFHGRLEDWWVRVHHDDQAVAESSFATALADLGIRTFELSHRVPLGPELRHVRAVGAIERSPEGAPLRVFGMYFDDTVQCQREAAITRAREAAESANRAKSVFLANMSHELRTPLNAILGFTQLISYDPAIGEENRGQLQVVYRSAEHLLALIDNVLELARVEAGRIQSVTEAFGLDDLVTTVGEIIRVRAEAKKLDLSVTVAPAVAGVVTGDAVHLRQVLVNLLGNAVKYTELGQVQLTVSPLADRVLFEVMDTGAGIASAELERIFQPFYQTRAGVETGEGVGLGLSISREFVRLMGGELTVRSVIGKGTTFAFAIPLPALDFSVLPEAPENEGTADRATPVPDGIDLSGVPDTLRRDLAAAADLLDLEASRNLLERLRCNHPVEAVVLGELIDGYRFESVSRLCRGKAA